MTQHTDLFDLTGTVALVTGGNSGIGVGLARGLLRAGAKVAIWGRDGTKNQTAEKMLAEHGEAAAFCVDVSSEASVKDGVRDTLARFGRIDSCFANAGYGKPQPFLDTSLEHWNELLGANLTGTFLTFREVLKHMVGRGGGGKLVALSSVGGLDHGMPAQAPYSSTKAAVCALVRSLAVEFARDGIQANAIVPGWIDTPATAPALAHEKLAQAVVRRTPARRWGTPADFEGTAVFLASRASDFITGELIRVDGGYTKF